MIALMLTGSNGRGLFQHISLDETTGCWNWTGPRDICGYGVRGFRGTSNYKVHRISAEFYLGFDPKSNLKVLHKCDNPSCFNPKHLFLGTILENNRDRDKKGRNGNSNKTHCKMGHPLSGENLYRRHTGSRECRACILKKKHDAYHAKKAA